MLFSVNPELNSGSMPKRVILPSMNRCIPEIHTCKQTKREGRGGKNKVFARKLYALLTGAMRDCIYFSHYSLEHAKTKFSTGKTVLTSRIAHWNNARRRTEKLVDKSKCSLEQCEVNVAKVVNKVKSN